MKRSLLVFVGVLAYAAPAYAYLDPGVGSAMVYVVVAMVLSAYYGIRGLSQRVAEFIFRSRFQQGPAHVAVHSEHPRYEITFMPILRALSERGVPFTYFTMYERGDAFDPLPEGGTHHAIPVGLAGYSLLNHLEARVFVTTTPQLDVMMFRRSKRVGTYCYVTHALEESIYSRPFAYDFYDAILCCGTTLEQNIRRMEGARNLPPKKLLPTGVPHYDVLIERAGVSEKRAADTTILVAPSWGPLSLFSVFGTDFVRALAERYHVVVRPHPQMKISQADLYAEILAMEGVRVDTAPTPAEAMAEADLLVSDFSGITHEFAFIHEKPVVVVDHGQSTEAFEGHLLGGRSVLKERCRDFIIPLTPDEIGALPERVAQALAGHRREQVAAVREALVYNFGNAAQSAARHIEALAS